MRVRGASYEVAPPGLGSPKGSSNSVGGGRRERNASSFPLGLTRPCRRREGGVSPLSLRHGKPPFSCPPLSWVPRGGRRSRLGVGASLSGGGARVLRGWRSVSGGVLRGCGVCVCVCGGGGLGSLRCVRAHPSFPPLGSPGCVCRWLRHSRAASAGGAFPAPGLRGASRKYPPGGEGCVRQDEKQGDPFPLAFL